MGNRRGDSRSGGRTESGVREHHPDRQQHRRIFQHVRRNQPPDPQGLLHFSHRQHGEADRRYDGMGKRHRSGTEIKRRYPHSVRRGLILAVSLLCTGAPHRLEGADINPLWEL